jgi:hypothetical protein
MTDTRIVTSTYRYKRPPRKRKPLVDVPAIITSVDPKKNRRLVRDQAAVGRETSESAHHIVGEAHPNTAPERRRNPAVTTAGKAPTPPNDDGPRKSAIITVPDRRLEKWERLTRGSSGSSDGDPETLDAWARALLAGKLRPGK